MMELHAKYTNLIINKNYVEMVHRLDLTVLNFGAVADQAIVLFSKACETKKRERAAAPCSFLFFHALEEVTRLTT